MRCAFPPYPRSDSDSCHSTLASTNMEKIRTHYENLKVSSNAPPEVIRAAYEVLSQRFHPDKHPSDPEAARIMAIINRSYEVLSDPETRKAHDIWITHQKGRFSQTENSTPYSRASQKGTPKERQTSKAIINRFLAHVFGNWAMYGIISIALWFSVADKAPPPAGPKAYVIEPTLPQPLPPPVQHAYMRPAIAPNGSPWPQSAGYVKGYKRLHSSGLSTVTVDNSRNDSDVFVKLVSLNGELAYPVRQFYIPASKKFTIQNISAGSYDIRYRDLENGDLSRSEAFNLEETQTPDGSQYSDIVMTLYKVSNGNMKSYGLSEVEF